MANNYAKVAQFKTVDAFRAYLKEQGIAIGLADLPPPEKSVMAQITENAPNSGMKYGDNEMAVLILG